MLKKKGIIIPTNINKLLDNVTKKDFFDALNLFESNETKQTKGGGNSNNEEEEVCPICQEEIGTRRLCGICLPESNTIPQGMWPYRCGHHNKHCMNCYYQIFSNSATCPLCRAQMYPVDHARRRVGRFVLPFMRERGWRPQTFDDWTDLFSYSMFAIIVLSVALNRSDESIFSRGHNWTNVTLFDILAILLTLWLFYSILKRQRRVDLENFDDLIMFGLHGGKKRRKKTRKKRGGNNVITDEMRTRWAAHLTRDDQIQVAWDNLIPNDWTIEEVLEIMLGEWQMLNAKKLKIYKEQKKLANDGNQEARTLAEETLERIIEIELIIHYLAQDIKTLVAHDEDPARAGGGKRRKKTRRKKRGGENDHCMTYNKKWWQRYHYNILRDEQVEDLKKADKYCRNHANFENNPGGGRYFPDWKCEVSTGECFYDPPPPPPRLTRTENATTFSGYDPDDPAAHVFDEDDGFTGGKRRKKTRRKPIRINPKMRGVFTKKAKKKGMSVQRYANYVIKKYKGKKKTKKQLKLLRQAVFAKTAKKWKKRRGGGKKGKIKDELRNIWRKEQKKTKKRKRGNKDMNTTQLMEAMNSPVKKKIKRNNEEFRRDRDKWINEQLQDGIKRFVVEFEKRFGKYFPSDVILYDIKRRKSLNLKQEWEDPDKFIEEYMNKWPQARLKVVFMNNFINSANRDYREKIKQNFWDDNPLYVKRYYENNKAMSQDSKGNWRKKEALIHPSQQATGDFRGRRSPIPMAGDPEKTVSLVMTRADHDFFFNRPGG